MNAKLLTSQWKLDSFIANETKTCIDKEMVLQTTDSVRNKKSLRKNGSYNETTETLGKFENLSQWMAMQLQQRQVIDKRVLIRENKKREAVESHDCPWLKRHNT